MFPKITDHCKEHSTDNTSHSRQLNSMIMIGNHFFFIENPFFPNKIRLLISKSIESFCSQIVVECVFSTKNIWNSVFPNLFFLFLYAKFINLNLNFWCFVQIVINIGICTEYFRSISVFFRFDKSYPLSAVPLCKVCENDCFLSFGRKKNPRDHRLEMFKLFRFVLRFTVNAPYTHALSFFCLLNSFLPDSQDQWSEHNISHKTRGFKKNVRWVFTAEKKSLQNYLHSFKILARAGLALILWN